MIVAEDGHDSLAARADAHGEQVADELVPQLVGVLLEVRLCLGLAAGARGSGWGRAGRR